MSDEIRKEFKDFMDARYFCVISTVDTSGKPESAFVAYTCNDEFEVVIGTSNKSRKYQNIEQNQSVALVIADTDGEVQYEGQAEILSASEYEALAQAGRFKLLAGFDKYRNDPTQVYLRIKPTWVRFIVHGETDRVDELRDFA